MDVSERELLKLAGERLAAYGLGSHYQVARIDAPANGWTARQIHAFLDDLERATIGEGDAAIRKYKPGQVWWQLTKGEPGSRITMAPSEAWVRADRDRRLRQERARQQDRDRAERARRRVDRDAEAEREQRFGPVLAGLEAAELRDLAVRALGESFAAAAGRERWLTTFRERLLRQLETEASEVVAPGRDDAKE